MRKALLPAISSPVGGMQRTYRTGALWVIVITVNGEDGDGDIEVWVLVVDSWEASR